mmetsp:Transcript_27023/g.89722  ORF Transcript_27023/g.89722 Transcript_27023/m.89722 type:complete len:203 (+) Transcript_27023:69-677(+)
MRQQHPPVPCRDGQPGSADGVQAQHNARRGLIEAHALEQGQSICEPEQPRLTDARAAENARDAPGDLDTQVRLADLDHITGEVPPLPGAAHARRAGVVDAHLPGCRPIAGRVGLAQIHDRAHRRPCFRAAAADCAAELGGELQQALAADQLDLDAVQRPEPSRQLRARRPSSTTATRNVQVQVPTEQKIRAHEARHPLRRVS